MDSTNAAAVLRNGRLTDGERAAVVLLTEHRDGYWVSRGEQCFRVLEDEVGLHLDWQPGLEAWSRRLGEPCDRAVLITALHLGGEAVAGEDLGQWWRHLDRFALASVLRAIATSAGARADVSDVGDAPLEAGIKEPPA